MKVGDDNTMFVNTASSVQSQDTMIVNSEAGTLVESDLGTMVINSDDDEDATMKSEFLEFFVACSPLASKYRDFFSTVQCLSRFRQHCSLVCSAILIFLTCWIEQRIALLLRSSFNLLR